MNILFELDLGTLMLIFIAGLMVYFLIKEIKNKLLMPYISYKTEERYYNSENLENIYQILDRFILEVFNEYKILNLEFREFDYINSELEKNILEDIITLINYKISPQLLNKLYTIYDTTSSEKVQDLIYRRVYIQLLDYVMEKNKIK